VIISHKHRFIFFAVPRTATHAVRQALRPHLGEDDWEQQALFGEQSIPVPGIAAIGHGHVSYQQLRACLPAEILSSYFKFGFVRNPFDRFVSTCFFLNRRNDRFTGNEVEFMRRAISNERFRQRVLARPQYRLLTDENDQLMMDYVGQYETLQESFDDICRQGGLVPSGLSHRNESRHRGYECYYDASLKESVVEYYRKDFQLFGYDAGKIAADPLTSKE
jgi:hypothetical protein